jgi:hypothetical protein
MEDLLRGGGQVLDDAGDAAQDPAGDRLTKQRPSSTGIELALDGEGGAGRCARMVKQTGWR